MDAVIPLGRPQADLASPTGAGDLADHLEPGDAIVFLAAVTPDKAGERDILGLNLSIAEAFLTAVAGLPPSHVIYMSSDAVYPFDSECITERTPVLAGTPYARAHVERENMFREAFGDRLTVLRPTLIYGPGDTHASYGPSRLCREALETGQICLFGRGEELRDHVYIQDVVRAVKGALVQRPAGPLNVASGTSIRYSDLARLIADRAGRETEIKWKTRKQPIAHRRFDVSRLMSLLPGHEITSIEAGIDHVLAALRVQTTDPSASRIVQ